VAATKQRLWVGLGAVALLWACGGPTRPYPPPEGEWLTWEPKGKAKEKHQTEDLDSPPMGSSDDSPKKDKPEPPPPGVSCNGKDNVRDSACVAKNDLGSGDDCPATLPKKASNARGTLELAPSGAKRDASLETGDQCCFAWCVHVNATATASLKCKKNESRETALCFEAPSSGSRSPAAGPYGDCPASLKHTKKNGRRLGYPQATLVRKGGGDSSRHACCYEACVKQ
jgi:hypothetical protein